MAKRYLFHKTFVPGIVLALLGAFMLIDAISFGRVISGGLGADFFPKIVSAAMLLTGIGLVAGAVSEIRKSTQGIQTKEAQPEAAQAEAVPEEAEQAEEKQEVPKSNWMMLAATAVTLLVYILILEHVGFILSTIPFTFALIMILSGKSQIKIWAVALISVLTSIATYLLFVNVFQVMLPPGLLG